MNENENDIGSILKKNEELYENRQLLNAALALALIDTAIAITATAEQLIGGINYYGVAIEIDNYFESIDLDFAGYSLIDGTSGQSAPKSTIKAGTRDTAGSFSDYSYWPDGSAGVVDYKFWIDGEKYCMMLFWSQQGFAKKTICEDNGCSTQYFEGDGVYVGKDMCNLSWDDIKNCFMWSVQSYYGNTQWPAECSVENQKIFDYNTYEYTWNERSVNTYHTVWHYVSDKYSNPWLQVKANMADSHNAQYKAEISAV